jgi:hypothetical protein
VGFSPDEIQFVGAARKLGVSFERTMTLGRQHFFGVKGQGGYVEPFLEALGAREVRSLDASAYEGATDVHDLNEPVDRELHAQFSAVIDSGTIEHVFNAPQALKTAMEMVALHGHLIMMTPCNQDAGHGFYQFSPELPFRALAEENGFRIRRAMLKEARGSWFDMIDPRAVGRRSEFRSRRTTYLYLVAERTAIVPVFARWPQQSDYSVSWTGEGTSAPAPSLPSRALTHARRLRKVVVKVRSWSYPPRYQRRRDHFRRSSL